MSALGFVETHGLLAAIEGADVMLKTADVSLLEKNIVGGGLVTITVAGEVSAVSASVEAAVAAIQRISHTALISSHVIPRPDEELAKIIATNVQKEELTQKTLTEKVIKTPQPEKAQPEKVQAEKTQPERTQLEKTLEVKSEMVQETPEVQDVPHEETQPVMPVVEETPAPSSPAVKTEKPVKKAPRARTPNKKTSPKK